MEMAKDAKENKGLTIYPRDLSVTWGNDARYWKWFWLLFESDDYKVIEIPRLLNVCWLEISGSISMMSLRIGLKYEVAFVIMMKSPEGWENSPVTLRLDLPDGKPRVRDIDLSTVPTDTWVTIPVDVFTATTTKGRVGFSMKEITRLLWKRGLIIKCVVQVL
ncbi:uncharacterized protein PHLOEM PROTEIN 2-LIKE A4-like [Asparagus officinalis]|uniref:uncharacterized protein PHLOEM PROTEIN 2-LIKE A4-like n=1 Tax=Asparagus officinalis TaxID=4686 RepID=UPI00098E1C97|nr:uncharacterized protein PHLOEM PROTEIN 2-LIKE A4-like [Asparagus officinalis]